MVQQELLAASLYVGTEKAPGYSVGFEARDTAGNDGSTWYTCMQAGFLRLDQQAKLG